MGNIKNYNKIERSLYYYTCKDFFKYRILFCYLCWNYIYCNGNIRPRDRHGDYIF